MLKHASTILLGCGPAPRVWRVGRILLAALALGLAPSPARAIDLPPGFVDDVLPFAFDNATKLAFLPDGRLLVAEKGGIVYLVNGGTRTSLWVGEDEVLNTDDRGLLSIAVDPNFEKNRFIYLLYVCDPDSNGIELDNYDDAYCRLTRYRMPDTPGAMLEDSTRTILIGTGWWDGFISASGTHSIGDLEWGLDGSLFVSCGDGGHFEVTDAGGYDPGQFQPGRSDPSEDIGAFRAQMLGSLNGKVLRINPASGCGLPDNPYWDGDSTSKRSRVWLSGLRNPFRITRVPGTGSSDPEDHDPGTLIVADVGWSHWEELNLAPAGGLNFGWPCFESTTPVGGYSTATPATNGCPTVGAPGDPSLLTPPWISLSHDDATLSQPPGFFGGSIIGGVHYTGTQYPIAYRNRYFFGDYVQNCIRVSTSRGFGRPPVVTTFSNIADGPVSFAADPISGDLYYAAIYTGQVHRIRYFAPGVGVDDAADAPGLALSAPRPNPARGQTSLTLELPTARDVQWEVLDVNGRRIWRSGTEWREAGEHTLRWPGVTRDGSPAGPGLYLVRVRAGATTLTRRCAVIR